MKKEEAIIKNRELFLQDLHSWYRAEARDLPWRRAPSVYKTVVSEFMLQQTQVKTVLPYFDRWMGLFPDFKALANAKEESVLKAWEGLGYYSRARNLQNLAKSLITLEEMPSTAEAWKQFKGVGEYTANAIASIGQGYPAAVVDGNVVRILSRLVGESRVFKDSVSAGKHFKPLADALLDPGEASLHNQAMMELGATVCFRANPLCETCPVNKHCLARKENIADQLPKFEERKKTRVVIQRALAIKDDCVLLHQRPEGSRRLANIYEVPEADATVMQLGGLVAQKKRTIGTQEMIEEFYRVELQEKSLAQGNTWVKIHELDQVVLSGPHRRWIKGLIDGITES